MPILKIILVIDHKCTLNLNKKLAKHPLFVFRQLFFDLIIITSFPKDAIQFI